MKKLLIPLLPLLAAIFITSCTPELIAPLETSSLHIDNEVDTIITFDPVTLEEVIRVIVDKEENLPYETYRIDTIIIFDPETYEETIEIIKTKVIAINKKTAVNKISSVESNEITIENEEYQIDTIITFNPETYEETIQVLRTKIPSKKPKKQ